MKDYAANLRRKLGKIFARLCLKTLIVPSCVRRKVYVNEKISTFVIEIAVSVVQWIEFWIPVPTIGVRLPTGIQCK